MAKLPDFSFCPQNKPRPGFSLVELLTTMLIISLIVGSVGSGLENFKKISQNYLRQTFFETPYLIFLLKIEEDYQEAETNLCLENGDPDKMCFYRDRNWDGDYGDSDDKDDDIAERIEYEWNSSQKNIRRKSRKTENSRFQAFLEEIADFEWKKLPDQGSVVCHQMRIKPALSQKYRTLKYCREH